MSSKSRSAAFLVMGASGGIGASLARKLVAQDNQVLLASRASDRLDALAEELHMPRHELDATDLQQVEDCFIAATEHFGVLHGAVNCVGSLLLKPAHLTTEPDWSHTIAANLTTAFATVRAAGKTMTSTGGSVVLMASAAARLGLPNHEAIAAAKAGVIGLARSAAATYASRGLRFNVVAPGLVKTKLTEKIWQNERSADFSRGMHAAGRLGEPEDIASLICWLLDPANSWITGEVISLDGGLATVRSNR